MDGQGSTIERQIIITMNVQQQQQHQKHQYRVLYTNQKTKKRKLWKDGKLIFQNAGKKCRLYEAYPLPGTVGGGVIIDELDLCGQQVVGDELESEKYLIRIEGPWNDEVDGRSGSIGNITNSCASTLQSKHSGGGGGSTSGGMGIMAGSSTLGSATTTTSSATASTVMRSNGMKKLLSKKYRMPPKVMPLHPEERRRRDNSLIRGGSACNQREMPPLQPGELERRYYGEGGRGDSESFGYDTERHIIYEAERRGARGNNDSGGCGDYNNDARGTGNFNGNGNGYDERAAARRGGESRSVSSYSNIRRMPNYDEDQRQTQRQAIASQNTNRNDIIPSRNHHLPSLNNEAIVGGIDQNNPPGSHQPIYDEQGGHNRQKWNNQDGQRQPSSTQTFPRTQRSNHNHATEIVSTNFKNDHQSFVCRGRGGSGSGHDSTNIGNATTRFISDGYDASRLYEEEESDSGNDDDEHDDDVGGRDTVGWRDDVRDTSSYKGNGTSAFQDGCIDGINDEMSGNNKNGRQQEDSSRVFNHQPTSTSAVPVENRHATDELLELLGVAAPVAAPSTLPRPPVDETIYTVMENSAKYRSNYSTIKAVGFAQNDEGPDEDQESSFLAGIIEAENQLQDRAIDTESSITGFGGWRHRENDWGENSNSQNEAIGKNEAFSSSGGLHLNNKQYEEETGTAKSFSGFTLPSADESTSSSEDEENEE